MKPRTHQTKAVDYVHGAKDKTVFVVSPPGSGKTWMISLLAKKFREEGLRVCIITHRNKILQQIVAQVKSDVKEEVSVVAMSRKVAIGPMTVACTGSIKKLEPSQFDVLLIDEAHRSLARNTHAFAKSFQSSKKKRLVGFSATPWRLDGKPMSALFDDLYVAASNRSLIKKGHILEPAIYTADPEMIPLMVAKQLHGGKSKKADFTGAELHKLVRESGLAGDLIATVKKHLDKRQAVGFGVSIEHCIDMTSRINQDAGLSKKGIKATFIHSKMARRTQETALRDFEKGDYRILFNVDILSEGWDMPSCGAVILARPTLSLSLYIQQAHRASRSAEGKEEPLLLDMACNSILHGHPSWDFNWDLEGTDYLDSLASEIQRAPVVCKACHRANTPGSKVCKGCGESLSKSSGNRALIPSELMELELRRTLQGELAQARNFFRSHNFPKKKEDAFLKRVESMLT